MEWKYGDSDPAALAELGRRIAVAGCAQLLINYSKLVEDVPFNLSNFRWSPRTIDVSDWQELDHAVVGDFLGYISMRSYERAGFFASALVVEKEDNTPGEGFWRLLLELELIATLRSQEAGKVWIEHVNKANAWFKQHP